MIRSMAFDRIRAMVALSARHVCPFFNSHSSPKYNLHARSTLLVRSTLQRLNEGVCFLSSEREKNRRRRRRRMAFMVENEVVYDVGMSIVSSGVALSLLRFWEEIAKLGVEKKLNRKLVHISIGMVFMLFWPLFSSGIQAPYLAALAPGINIFRMLLMGLGIVKNETMVKSMSRDGHCSELLKGPLYYACTVTLATILYWRTSPIGIAAICNLCVGDGVADIIGRRYGKEKLPYNKEKSFAGSLAMGASGFLASIMYMHYFSMFGLIEGSWGMALGFFVVSLASTIVESLPISSELDDNLTVPLTSFIVGAFVF